MNVTLNPKIAAAPAVAAHPRIRYIDPLALGSPDGMAAAIARAAASGFDSVLIPPPWAPGSDQDRFVPASLTRVHPALGGGDGETYLLGFVQACRAEGLRPMLDMPLASLAAEFDGEAGPFSVPAGTDALDPRHGGAPQHRTVTDPAAIGAWWAGYVGLAAGAGIAGLRLLGLAEAPGVVPALRDAAPGMTLIAWTPGMPRDMLPGLRGVSYVASSLPWWDMRSDWFWDEMAVLRDIAPVLACPEAPFGPRAAAAVHNPAMLAATLRRAAAVAAATGDGWIVPEGFETGARRAMDVHGRTFSRGDRTVADSVGLAALNRGLAAGGTDAHAIQPLTAPGASPMALLRTDAADARFARQATVSLVNTDLERACTIDPAGIVSAIDGTFGPWEPAELQPLQPITLRPGELHSFTAPALPKGRLSALVDSEAAKRMADGPRVAIEMPAPCVDDGSLPVKCLVGEVVSVEVDVVCDGHDKLGVALQWHEPGSAALHEVRMVPAGNDRYRAAMPLNRLGAYDYTVQAWRDVFATYKDEIAKKSAAGVDVTLELREGMALLTRTAGRTTGGLQAALQAIAANLATADDAAKLAQFLSPGMGELMLQADDRPRAASLPRPIRIDAERSGAAFSAWYEVFPRSMSGDANRHGTFRDVERHLPRVQAMGFDVLYFPPVSPIGRSNRKGPNNTLTPAEGDPGSPYAIGSAEGGHDALHPELGTLAGLPAPGRRRGGSWAGDRDRLRHPVFARSPLAEAAPGLVRLAAGWLDQIR